MSARMVYSGIRDASLAGFGTSSERRLITSHLTSPVTIVCRFPASLAGRKCYGRKSNSCDHRRRLAPAACPR